MSEQPQYFPPSDGMLEPIEDGTDTEQTISPWEILGISPNFTGGLSVDEYMNQIRGE